MKTSPNHVKTVHDLGSQNPNGQHLYVILIYEERMFGGYSNNARIPYPMKRRNENVISEQSSTVRFDLQEIKCQ